MQTSSKTESCRLLADPGSPAAKRHQHYDAFLDHNHRALQILAELELLDRGAGLATLSSIQRRTRELLQEVRGLVTALCGLADNRYQKLFEVLDTVENDLAPLLERRRDPIEGPLILPFAALDENHMFLSGAKAVKLALVKNKLGLQAPDGFSVTTAAFDLFLKENQLLEPIDDLLSAFDPDTEQGGDVCRRIQEMIKAAPLPPALKEAFDKAYQELAADHEGDPLLAMRSSAVGEDTEASFAGQYTTVLPVDKDHMDSAYTTVLASKYTPRAIVYRLRYGLTDMATPMGVAGVVMIQSRASGVLYSTDPARPDSGLVRIDAMSGMGEQVVGGSASPDVFHVDRTSREIVDRRIQPKEDDLAETTEPAISDKTVLELAAIALKLEEHFGSPQDIEWAEDQKGELFILQTRPLGISAGEKKEGSREVSGLELLLSAGQTASPGRVSGKAVSARADLKPEEAEDAILISRTAPPDLAPFMGRVRGLITDVGGAASHLASVAREYNVPTLMDTRKATALIAEGQEITLLADEAKVYLGLDPELARKFRARNPSEERGPIGNHLRELLDRISPLNLTDPKAPEFSPQGCRTVHDLIRFAHEKAMGEMFNLSGLSGSSVVSRKLSTNLPLTLYFLDLGDGLATDLTSCDAIRPEHIRSRPMKALWRGLSHPGITWSGAVGMSAGNFMALMAGSIGPENATPPEVDSYALVSRDYLNLSVKFGYHYSNIDALCSDEPGANTITLQFSGGAGTGVGKSLRIEFLSRVLTRLGYEVETRGDLLQASLKGLDCEKMDEVLDQTGRLLGCSRLLDLAIPNQAEVQTLTELFFKGEYDFLGRSETRVPGFYASLGEWSLAEFEGSEVIFQDGSSMEGTVSCSLHSALDKVIGDRYRKFLERRHALHYYPVAVARDSRCADARIRVEVRILSGCVDLAAGLAFGLQNVGNSLVLAADAGTGELQLLEFVNNKRHFRRRTAVDAISMDSWLQLEVSVAGREITGFLAGRPVLQFTAPHPVSGYVGLWSSGETSAYFRNLDIHED
ncbi:MAG: PEP/pyruvate-binding domain-containing protein [Desulfovibrionales bacterium]